MLMPPRFSLDSPYLGDYFGLWHMHVPTFEALAQRVNGTNLHVHLSSAAVQESVQARDEKAYPVTRDGIAVISVRGPMMKAVPSMAEGTSSVRVRQQLSEARRDPEVLGAMLVLDTPGGTVKGNADLANSVSAFAGVKPIYSFTEDLTASAGVSIASQAHRRYANQATALYGSMGTYAVIQDLSGMAEQLGVKVHVVKAGEFKGAGQPGTPITESQLAEWQREVNALNEAYLGLIAGGLRQPLERIRELADGRIHMAADAVKLGLLDGVQSYEETYRQLVIETAKLKPGTSSRSSTMSASLAELKAKFPKSTAEWRESQLEAGASLADAAVNYAQHVEETLATERKAHSEALAKVKEEAEGKGKTAGASLGHLPIRPVVAGRDELDVVESDDAIENFNAAVAKVAGPKADLARRQSAVRVVARDNPDLYKAYLLAANPGKRASRVITEKLETVAAK